MWLSLLSMAAPIVLRIFAKAGASEQTQKDMALLFKRAQNDAAIAKKNKDELKQLHGDLSEEIKKGKTNGNT